MILSSVRHYALGVGALAVASLVAWQIIESRVQVASIRAELNRARQSHAEEIQRLEAHHKQELEREKKRSYERAKRREDETLEQEPTQDAAAQSRKRREAYDHAR